MYRKIERKLLDWEKSGAKEPLMVTGARQVGKTWSIRHFCSSTYEDVLYLNLEEQPSYQSAFEGDVDPKTIMRNLGILAGRKLTENTVLVLDEIQVCERAITALKYFCEAEECYKVIAAGSLLGVKIKRFESSFPVGKVRILQMLPMDFEEFLLASGEELLRDAIVSAASGMQPLPSGIHEKALQLCRDYMIVGGMPKAVERYVQQGKEILSFGDDIHRDLILAYLADMQKHVTSPYETVKISQVYQSIPRQLGKENPKFKYSVVRENANRRDFEAPLDWLRAAGMIYEVDAVELPERPLKGYVTQNQFKVYLSDVGILSSMCGIRPKDLMSEEPNRYKGAVVENYVFQQMAVNYPDLYYFKPSDSMEIDAVLDNGDMVIPIEIKSGRHKRSASLNRYIEKYGPAYAVRISAFNFGKTNGLYSCPLYAAFCLPAVPGR